MESSAHIPRGILFKKNIYSNAIFDLCTVETITIIVVIAFHLKNQFNTFQTWNQKV